MTEDTFKDMIVFADAAAVSDTTFQDLDRYALDDYLDKVYATTLDGFGAKAEQVLKNIHVLNHQGVPTLAGYLFFGKHPERHCPTCMVKAVSFFGNDLASCQYRDTKELLGNMPRLYEQCIAFLKGNLHNLQERGASFNTLGKLEIARTCYKRWSKTLSYTETCCAPPPSASLYSTTEWRSSVPEPWPED